MSEEMNENDEPEQERRRFERVPVTARVELVKDCTVWDTQLQDISLKGLLVDEPDQWPEDDGLYEIRIKLSDVTPTGEIKMNGEIAHQTDGTIGFEQVEITSENLAQLRELLEDSLDAEQIERELTELIE